MLIARPITRERTMTNRKQEMQTPALVYLADLTYTQQGLQSEIMPQAIGGLGTYAIEQLGERIEVRVFKKPEDLTAALETAYPQVIGFSSYAWNTSLAFAFARTVKANRPAGQ